MFHHCPSNRDQTSTQYGEKHETGFPTSEHLRRWADVLAQQVLVGNRKDTALGLLTNAGASLDEVVDVGLGGGGWKLSLAILVT